MKLFMFKMLTPKRENKKRFPTRLWIPDRDHNFWCAVHVLHTSHFPKHTYDNREEVVLNWTNFDISTFFPPESTCPVFRIF